MKYIGDRISFLTFHDSNAILSIILMNLTYILMERNSPMLNHFISTIPLFDAGIRRLLAAQCMDDASVNYGATVDFRKGFPEASCGIAAACITAFYTPESEFYKNPELLNRACLAMDYQLARQHEDGTIDLVETNFHDSTSNAFNIQGLGPAYKILRRFTSHSPEEDALEERLYRFTKASGDAMVNCGFHTPNHRWVVSGALALCYSLLGDESYLHHIYRFLNEGIDCDENGEYTERSAGTYNIICNRSLILIAHELGMPELYDHVTRNLYLSMKYFEPDETICTMNSTRQDAGTDPSISAYYENFLYMAIETQNPEFAWMADYLQTKNLARFTLSPSSAAGSTAYFYRFLLEPEFVQKMLATPTKPPVPKYETLFVESGVYRYRDYDLSFTLIQNQPMFAKLQYKQHRVFFRFAGSFFGTLGQFQAQEILPIDNGYRLHYHARQGYRRPFMEKPDTWKWRDMDHSKRETVCVQDFDVNLDFSVHGNKLNVTVSTCGCERVPVKMELLFDAGGLYETPDTEFFTKPGDYVFWKRGTCQYRYSDGCAFVLNGGFYAHHYGATMRGSCGASPQCFTIVTTGFTPVEQVLSLSVE